MEEYCWINSLLHASGFGNTVLSMPHSGYLDKFFIGICKISDFDAFYVLFLVLRASEIDFLLISMH